MVNSLQGLRPVSPTRILLHATALDFHDKTGKLYGKPTVSPLIDAPNGKSIDKVLKMRQQILALKSGRESAARAIDFTNKNPSGLRLESQLSVGMMAKIAGALPTYGFDVLHYGLADMANFNGGNPEHVYRTTHAGKDIIVRSEEGLAPHAEAIAKDIKRRVKAGKILGAKLEDDGRSLVREAKDGTASMSLYGYTFRHGPGGPTEAVRFADFPACEPFLAATVMEQLMLADVVIRVVPWTFKKKEYAARWILEQFGKQDLPVISVAFSADGSVNKIIHWGGCKNDFSEVCDVLKAMRTNRDSRTKIYS